MISLVAAYIIQYKHHMNIDMDVDDAELQSFLELDDDEMKAVIMISNAQVDAKTDKSGVGKGRSALGSKRPYDPYKASTAFTDVKCYIT